MALQFPTPLHQRVLDEVIAELQTDTDVCGIMLVGSVARGTARADSDLDLVIVATEDNKQPWQLRPHPLPVDFTVRTAEQWREHFTPNQIGDESWGYAFLDGVILHDPTGTVARLTTDIPKVHARYRVPAHIKNHYARLWRHVRPKMQAVLQRNDPVEIGWAAAAMTNDLVRTVWAANDLPNPSLDLGTFHRHLDDLTIPTDVADRLRDILRTPPTEALRQQLNLITAIEPHLEPAERSSTSDQDADARPCEPNEKRPPT
ncbi:nucleotidyltransferase domain-containing protein [Amycolatopsis acididurans]|nr:nucleotidyltransferase domain-containing protein [Amycolatopsis acididurans]